VHGWLGYDYDLEAMNYDDVGAGLEAFGYSDGFG
jgi:hypothetical protein